MYVVYALYSRKLDRLYIGQTKDLTKRLDEHQRGLSFYTRRSDDWDLIHTEDLTTRTQAMRREKELKTSRGRQFLRRIISGGC